MVMDAKVLLREALALPDRARADLVAELLASFDEPATDDAETTRDLWRDELERRARQQFTGQAAGEDWDSLRQRLTDELGG